MTYNSTPADIQDRLLKLLQHRAANFIQDADREKEFDQAVQAIYDIAERGHVKLDTLSMLFPDGGK